MTAFPRGRGRVSPHRVGLVGGQAPGAAVPHKGVHRVPHLPHVGVHAQAHGEASDPLGDLMGRVHKR